MAFRSLAVRSTALCRRALATEAGGNTFPLIFSSPYNAIHNNAPVKQVDIPSTTGHFGILPNHVPTIAILVPGVISIHTDAGDIQKYFVSSGTATIHADSSVQIVAEEICELADIDGSAVRAGLDAAQSKLASASSEVDKATAQIEVDVYQSMMAAA